MNVVVTRSGSFWRHAPDRYSQPGSRAKASLISCEDPDFCLSSGPSDFIKLAQSHTVPICLFRLGEDGSLWIRLEQLAAVLLLIALARA